MKFLQKSVLSMAAAAMAVAMIPPAQAAGSDSKTFNVTVTLNAACSISAGPGTVNFGNYNAVTNGAVNANTAFGVTCTNNLPYSMSFDAVTQSVAGLAYALEVRDATDTTTVTGSQTGTGSQVSYNVYGSMAGGQAGDASASATQTRTLTVSY